ncbi:mCG1025717, isoform CRA_a, partial [Mus musculus]
HFKRTRFEDAPPRCPDFSKFCFICQVLKTANTTIIIHKEIHPPRGPVPRNQSEMLTASQGFPTAGTRKQLRFSSPTQMAKRECVCWYSRGWLQDGKAGKNFCRCTQPCSS